MRRLLAGFLRRIAFTSWKRIAPSPVVRLASLSLLLTLPLTLILTFQLLPSRYQLGLGDVSSQTIKSVERVSFVSQYLTRLAREQAASQVPDVLSYDATVGTQQLASARDLLGKVSRVLETGGLTRQQRQEALASLVGPEVPTVIVGHTADLDVQGWQLVSAEVSRLVEEAMRGRVTAEAAVEAKMRLSERASPTLTTAQAQVVVTLVSNYLRPNYLVDRAATDERRKQAREAVQPVRVTMEKGEVILRDGDVVQEVDLERLEAAGLLHPRVAWTDIAGTGLLVGSLCLMLVAYIHVFLPGVLRDDRRLLLLVVVVVGAVLAAKLTLPGRPLYAFVFPLAAAPMLVATLVDGQLAVLVAAMLSVLVSYVVGAQVDLAAGYLMGGLAGVFCTWKADRLNRFFLAGIAVAAASYLVVVGFSLLSADYSLSSLALYGFLAAVHGILAAALTVGIFAILGHIFGITTILHLLELAHPNQPLLRLLVNEAPGTYHHSIIVGNLAERAAEAIGADSLLVRVGSYYHDIGKVMRPGFFVDNQVDGKNVHDTLDPQTSARIIVGHVSDGLALARKYGLPARVRDFIAEHHGSRMAGTFYQRAKQEGNVDPSSFGYPGPRPQSRETALVMLADAIEACARATKDHSPDALDRVVDKIVAQRLEEGQLDESDLTLRDIARARQAFKGVLRGVFHPRVEYLSPPPQNDELTLMLH